MFDFVYYKESSYSPEEHDPYQREYGSLLIFLTSLLGQSWTRGGLVELTRQPSTAPSLTVSAEIPVHL